MNDRNRISVVIPVYNVENYISECIDSVLNQLEIPYEIILIDDGSKDRSPEICDSYALRDDRIKVIHQKNAGVCEARNAGLDAATGSFVLFCDSMTLARAVGDHRIGTVHWSLVDSEAGK